MGLFFSSVVLVLVVLVVLVFAVGFDVSECVCVFHIIWSVSELLLCAHADLKWCERIAIVVGTANVTTRSSAKV